MLAAADVVQAHRVGITRLVPTRRHHDEPGSPWENPSSKASTAASVTIARSRSAASAATAAQEQHSLLLAVLTGTPPDEAEEAVETDEQASFIASFQP